MINTKELEAAMRRAGVSMKELAAALKLSSSGLSKKMNHHVGWKVSQVIITGRVLKLSGREVVNIFFPDTLSITHTQNGR